MRCCVIGLPSQLLKRLKAACKQAECSVTIMQAKVGPRGTLRLLPHPSQAVATVSQWTKADGGVLLCLPYAPVSRETISELKTAIELGWDIRIPKEGDAGWPILGSRRPSHEFLEALHTKIQEEFDLVRSVSARPSKPSEILASLSKKTPRLIVANKVRSRIDNVSRSRYEFMVRGIQALADYATKESYVGGTLDSFFADRNLAFAQSGPTTTDVTLCIDGHSHRNKSTRHLKKGDKTTPASAARIYFQVIDAHKSGIFVVIVYAGIHPEQPTIVRKIEHWTGTSPPR